MFAKILTLNKSSFIYYHFVTFIKSALLLANYIQTFPYLCTFKKQHYMTTLNELNAVSPIDGRYRSKTVSLAPFFSEEALIKYRVLIEIEYFISFCEIPLSHLEGIYKGLF